MIASAPCKAIILGEHFVVYGARAIATAIESRVAVSAEKDDAIVVNGSEYGSMRKDDYSRVIADAVLRVAKMYGAKHGMRIESGCTELRGGGLGWSSAFCVAAACAAGAVCADSTGKEPLSRNEAFRVSLDAERTMLPVSGIDTAVSAYGGTILYDANSGPKQISHPQVRLRIRDTGLRHKTADMLGAVRKFKDSDGPRFQEIMDAHESLVDAALPAIREADLVALGRTIKSSQKLLREIGVSNNAIDSMILDEDGASYGSKITGAGGGGHIISIVDAAASSSSGSLCTNIGADGVV